MKYIQNIIAFPLLFCLLFLMIPSLSAQSVFPDTSYQKQFGVNATGLLANIFQFNDENSFDNPVYYFHSRKKKKNKNKNNRLGFGGNIQILGNGDGSNTFLLTNFRAGSDKSKYFGKAWEVYYGWDFHINLEVRAIGDNSSWQIALGPAPVFGLQYRLNERLSISTEASYHLLTLFSSLRNFDNIGIATRFSAPDFIYLNYHF